MIRTFPLPVGRVNLTTFFYSCWEKRQICQMEQTFFVIKVRYVERRTLVGNGDMYVVCQLVGKNCHITYCKRSFNTSCQSIIRRFQKSSPTKPSTSATMFHSRKKNVTDEKPDLYSKSSMADQYVQNSADKYVYILVNYFLIRILPTLAWTWIGQKKWFMY